jgi:tetratricopeptide (TPR) repeat protein
VTFNLGDADEGFRIGRAAVALSPDSHVSHQILGLMLKAKGTYPEALKQLQAAAAIQPDNIAILRDISACAIQLRRLREFLAVRAQLLKAQPRSASAWLGLAVAQHLTGAHAAAIASINTAIELAETATGQERLISDLLQFRHVVAAGVDPAPSAQIASLNEIHDRVIDTEWLAVQRAIARAALGERSSAVACLHPQLILHPDSGSLHDQLLAAVCAVPSAPTEEEADTLLAEYAAIRSAAPKSILPVQRALPLIPADSPDFAELAVPTLHRGIARGIPALFSVFRPAMADPARAARVLELLAVVQDASHDLPLAWCLIFRARAPLLTDAQVPAVAAAKEAVEAVSDMPATDGDWQDVAVACADVFTQCGELDDALLLYQRLADVDQSDRFVTTHLACTLMRLGQTDAGLKAFSRFIGAADPLMCAAELQNAPILLSFAASCLRNGEDGPALRAAVDLLEVLDDVEKDQMEFHSYVLRNGTVRDYLAYLTWEAERIRSTPEAREAALIATRVLGPRIGCSSQETVAFALVAAKKHKAAYPAYEERYLAAVEKDRADGVTSKRLKEDDPSGWKLAATAAPATKLLSLIAPVWAAQPADPLLSTAAACCYVANGKLIPAARAAKGCASSPALASGCAALILAALDANSALLAAPLVPLLQKELAGITAGRTLAELVAELPSAVAALPEADRDAVLPTLASTMRSILPEVAAALSV